MTNGKISQANGRLAAAKVGLKIEALGDRLYLRGTLPPKPGSNRTAPYQQRIKTGLRANAAGISQAEKTARLVDALLQQGIFSWEPYLQAAAADPLTVADWIERFEKDYFTRRKRTPQSETTWRHDYQKVFRKLPPGALLTDELMKSAIEATEPDSRTRKRFVDVLTRLSAFAGIEVSYKPLKGAYSPKSASPRSLPDDEAIAAWRERIPNPLWQRAYGLIAAYGLRDHEVIKSTLEGHKLRVHQDTKTGSRVVYPYYPEWAENWDLQGELPSLSGPDNSAIGNRVTHAFKRYQIPFTPYNLRHAWAVRTIKFRVPDTLAAKMMGHSVTVHCATYHAWISDSELDRLHQTATSWDDRPLPP